MSQRTDRLVPLRARRILALASAVLGAVTLIGMVVLWPRGGAREDLRRLGLASEVFDARVVNVVEGPCTGTSPQEDILCRRFSFELLEGPDTGRLIEVELPTEQATPRMEEGDKAVLAHNPEATGGFEYSFADLQRKPPLFWLALLFAAAVVLLGRLRGLAALAGLVASFVVLLQFVLPSILEGRSPIAVAIFGSAAIAFLALYLAHGFGPMTTVALLGTLGSLALTAALAGIFLALARISGFASEEAAFVRLGAAQVDLAGLILGGVVIGALGALDDMTVTQASAVWELRSASPEMPVGDLFRAGLRIGRAHVASTVNTLVLAYAGASMPLLLLLILSQQSLGTVANGEVVATEIVRTLVGSIGLVASVPLTTWLAARVVAGPGD